MVDTIKLNCDAIMDKAEDKQAIGFVARDNHGVVLKAAFRMIWGRGEGGD